MSQPYESLVADFMAQAEARNPNEPEFLQSVREVAEIVIPYIEQHPKYKKSNILNRLIEPERVVMFRVPWVDDNDNVQVNRGYRVQFNSAIGPYKGGLRFHPSVNLSILKFLGFEQIFKNALTTLPLGGAKGGSEFDPKNKSDREVMHFCQSFMTELQRHINKYTDIPAGDIGVGPREIGFLFGQYKRLQNEFTGVLTGKDLNWGGSFIRPEATGYGAIYFIEEMLARKQQSFDGKRVIVSGSGNVSQYAIEKIISLGGKVLTASDSDGFIYAPDGFNTEHLNALKTLKNEERGRVEEMANRFDDIQWFEDQVAWQAPCEVDIVLPCATQNELNAEDAQRLIERKVHIVAEGANMPCTSEAVHLFQKSGVLFAPGKAVNAGGVAASGLEMAQNSLRLSWDREKVDTKLLHIMKNIHQLCVEFGSDDKGNVDYVKGANLAGFVKVADAMRDQGVV